MAEATGAPAQDQEPQTAADLCLALARQYEARIERGRDDNRRSRALAATLREYAEMLEGGARALSARDLLAAWSLALHAHGQPSDLGQLAGSTGRCLTLAEWIMMAGGMPRGADELAACDYAVGGQEVLRVLALSWLARSTRHPGDRRYSAMAATSARELSRAGDIMDMVSP